LKLIRSQERSKQGKKYVKPITPLVPSPDSKLKKELVLENIEEDNEEANATNQKHVTKLTY